MISDIFLTIFTFILNFLFVPLDVINLGIDLTTKIPFFASFLQVLAYLLPWNSLLPLFVIVVSILSFKIIVAAITSLWRLLPFA